MILIVRPDLAPSLRTRLGSNPTVEVFAASDSLRALAAILARKPAVVALDASFAETARGAALIARVQADPKLAHIDLRVLAEGDSEVPVILGESIALSVEAMARASRPLDQCGTRLAPRFTMPRDAAIVVDGEPSRLINLSATGAQVLTRVRLQPGQAAWLVLADGGLRPRATVAWSSAELADAATTYRVGLQFVDADEHQIEAYCARVGTPPAPRSPNSGIRRAVTVAPPKPADVRPPLI